MKTVACQYRGMPISQSGGSYVCDCNNHRIQVFRVDGTFARKFGTRGSYEGQFNRPYGVSVVCDQLFVEYVNHRIQVFHCDGTFVRIFGSEESNEGQLAYIIESKCFTVAEHLSEIWMRFNGPFWALMFLLLISSSNK